MSNSQLALRMLPVDKIRPNPFQPRESFPRIEIEELANTIKKVGIIQPIIVREEDGTFRIISGERRWRAAQFAGLLEIPAIVKDVDDSQLLLESLIENLHRADLKPLEKARAIFETYKMSINDIKANELPALLRRIDDKQRRPEKFKDNLSENEIKIKLIADSIGLSYRYQVELLEGLKLTHEEQKKALELGLTSTKISSISTIDDEETRKIMIERATELDDKEVRSTVRILRNVPEDIKSAILNKEVEPEIAHEIMKVYEPGLRSQVLDIAKKGVYTKEGLQTRIDQLIKPRIEISKDTLENQIHNKTMWNLKRSTKYDIYTIGYEKRSINQYIELLKVASIKTLIDARKNPISQYKPDFNRDNLKKILQNNNIKYIHLPELGVPTEIRKQLTINSNYEWFFNWYDDNVIPILNNKAPELEKMVPIAFMCTEFDPTKCHRHRIALWFEKRGQKTLDL